MNSKYNSRKLRGSNERCIYLWLTRLVITKNTEVTVSFGSLSWQPTDNANLATALNAKQKNTLATQTAYTSKWSATKVPQITTNTLWQVTWIAEVTITQPTKTSDLTNDSGFITSSSVPTKVSDLTNDSWYLTSATWVTSVNGSHWDVTVTVPTKTSDLTNDSWFITSSSIPTDYVKNKLKSDY